MQGNLVDAKNGVKGRIKKKKKGVKGKQVLQMKQGGIKITRTV